uniref:Protein kinase domain-containing protein n=1 Tax=Panagrolaimus sp. ES5 TaxID=591445 RepID=A0AC34FVH2_9BILA
MNTALQKDASGSKFKTEVENEGIAKIGVSYELGQHNYTIIAEIGTGSYGSVYKVKNEKGDFFAIKCAGDTPGINGLESDCQILKLAESIESPHFCKLFDKGFLERNFYYGIMTLTLRAIHDLHKLGHVHCDIKDDNFAIGQEGTLHSHIVFILDFGMTKTIQEDGVKATKTRPSLNRFHGCNKYCSIAAMKRQWPSRNDDLESWMYMILKWFNFALEWEKEYDVADNIKMKETFRDHPKETLKKILECCPPGFCKIYSYIRGLQWGIKPDYDFISKFIDEDFIKATKSKTYFLEWDSSKVYNEPVLSKDGPINPKFKVPYFQKSQKRHGHFNVIHQGDTFNFAPPLRTKIFGNTKVARMVCNIKNGTKVCERQLLVADYDESIIQDGDEVKLITVEGQHTCRKRSKL